MSKDKNNKEEAKFKKENAHHVSDSVTLDDEQRVKVLSPAALVFKRFIRNKLAITGMCILVVMFLFSFIGGIVSPYRQDQVFKKFDYESLTYANAAYNKDLRFSAIGDSEFPGSAKAAFLLAMGKNQEFFQDDTASYKMEKVTEDYYTIEKLVPQLTVSFIANQYVFEMPDGSEVDTAYAEAVQAAIVDKATDFEYDGVEYTIVTEKRTYDICVHEEFALATYNIYDAYNQDDENFVNSYEFKYMVENAIAANETTFELAGKSYTVSIDDEASIIYEGDGNHIAAISEIAVNAADTGLYLDIDMKNAFREAIYNKTLEFEYDGVEYILKDLNATFFINTETYTELISMFETPSKEHILGTDTNGMDVMTRLMFGGRVSLSVGFVVVIIELIIGVMFGGISGYFGGWVDTCLMRFVDLFNCIPTMPMLIIIGSVLDAQKIEPQIRIYMLMVILGVLGWTGIARVVRGQILSLREQDFMIATEATGIKVRRRISKHLVPNVMPLLIVQATMSLGGIIITEATLSFLGLGVKYPLASWGTIINSATNLAVMTHYWFMWIPAGLLILLTVLGFNFVGDGLRDAFDPRMKR